MSKMHADAVRSIFLEDNAHLGLLLCAALTAAHRHMNVGYLGSIYHLFHWDSIIAPRCTLHYCTQGSRLLTNPI